MNHTEIAAKLLGAKENILLVYAFNATGKTRLSVAYKNNTKDPETGAQTGLYYNAFSEDLFVWDNDIDNGEENIKLDIKPSSLNKYYSLLEEEALRAKLAPYNPDYDFFFDQGNNPEAGISSIKFIAKGEDETPIKISRGEERIFVWCFYLALFEIEGLTNKHNAHFFIDDPVSSQDDQNIFITAWTVISLIERHFKNKKIIVTSHHFGFISILSDWLVKGDKREMFDTHFLKYVLQRKGSNLELLESNKIIFLYHLRLLQILTEANKNDDIRNYHFVMLRQVLESISSFLGSGQFSFVLSQIGIQDTDRTSFIVNALSHESIFTYKSELPVLSNLEMFREVFDKLKRHYKFKL